ncbi:taurine catabolism dioxygenase [Gautieria morchelliformis]|nr:taurine catabolism dioxygenase [Gautieria morchelliformis]
MAPAPFSLLGSLSEFDSRDETPAIGTLFTSPNVQLCDILVHTNSDIFLRDLATLVSHRGVVFFKNQRLSVRQLKELGSRLGTLSGKPTTSTLHKHPISESTPELGADISVISSEGGIARADYMKGNRASNGWHSDITFEHVPADYTLLKMHLLPPVGGDTLWASGYEAYDRLSPTLRSFLEGLTAIHNADFFVEYAKQNGQAIHDPRGSPDNTGSDLTAVHPVIRTNPVTGFKCLFVNKTFTKRIVELLPEESDALLEYLFKHISENHDLQVRYRWEANDVAIWDNRSTYHTATNDYGNSRRAGDRVVSIGEKPFLDSKSRSRSEVLDLAY